LADPWQRGFRNVTQWLSGLCWVALTHDFLVLMDTPDIEMMWALHQRRSRTASLRVGSMPGVNRQL
ncbi:MAG: hypothetical protein ACYCTG_11065, partial [Ferrimicrobium sp.]